MKKIFLIILFLLVNFIFAKNIQNGQIIKTKTFLLDTAMDSNTVYHYAIGYHDTIFTVIWKHGSDSLRLKRFSKNYQNIDTVAKTLLPFTREHNICMNQDSIFIVYGVVWGYITTESIELATMSRGNLSNITVKSIAEGFWATYGPLDFEVLKFFEPAIACYDNNLLITYKSHYCYCGSTYTEENGPHLHSEIIDLQNQDIVYNTIKDSSMRSGFLQNADYNRPTSVCSGDSSFWVLWPYDKKVLYYFIKMLPDDSISMSGGELYKSNQRINMGGNAISYGEGNFIGVWGDYNNGAHAIMASKMNNNGEIIDSATVIYTNQNVKGTPSISYNGQYFIVVWPEFISVPTENSLYRTRHVMGFYNIKGIMMDSSFNVIEQFNITNDTSDQIAPFIKTADNNVSMILYTNIDHADGISLWGALTNYYSGIKRNSNINEEGNLAKVEYINNEGKNVLKYSLQNTLHIKINIYNLTGRVVKSYDFGNQAKGTYYLNMDFNKYTNGVYFYNFQYNNKSINGKLVNIK